MNNEEKIQQLERQVQELLAWKEAKTRQQLSYPLDSQSVNVISEKKFITTGFRGDGMVVPVIYNLTGGPETIDIPPFPFEFWQVNGEDNKFIAVYQANI